MLLRKYDWKLHQKKSLLQQTTSNNQRNGNKVCDKANGYFSYASRAILSMKTFLLFFLSSFLLSCAVDEVSDESASNDSNSNLICKVEEITGSNIKKKVCYTKQQIERQREVAQEALRRRSSAGSASNPNP